MPVSMTALTGGGSTVDASSYATASITPSADVLVLLHVVAATTAGASATPTASGNGLTWVQVATQEFVILGGSYYRQTLFRAMGASPSAGAITIDFGGQTQWNCRWSVAEFGSVDTGGTNGSAAVVQSVLNTGEGTAWLVTLAAFGNANNATYGAWGEGGNSAITVGTGFTQIHQTGSLEGIRLCTQWRDDNDTSVDASTAGVLSWGGIAIEIKFSAPAAGGVTGPIWI